MKVLSGVTQSQLLMWLVYVLVKASVAAAIVSFVYWAINRTSPEFKAFVAATFSESGSPSFSRVATGALVAACIAMDAFLVAKNHAFPDVGGQVLLISTLYGVNVAGATVAKKFMAAQPNGNGKAA